MTPYKIQSSDIYLKVLHPWAVLLVKSKINNNSLDLNWVLNRVFHVEEMGKRFLDIELFIPFLSGAFNASEIWQNEMHNKFLIAFHFQIKSLESYIDKPYEAITLKIKYSNDLDSTLKEIILTK